jgi:hypothetical protein
VTLYGVWICNRLYWTLTERKYDSPAELHTPKITVTTVHVKRSQFVISSPVVAWWRFRTVPSASVLTFIPAGDCLVANSLFQLSTLNSALANCFAYNISARTAQKAPFLCYCFQTCLFAKPLLSNGCCIAPFAVVAWQRIYDGSYTHHKSGCEACHEKSVVMGSFRRGCWLLWQQGREEIFWRWVRNDHLYTTNLASLWFTSIEGTSVTS